MSIIKLIIFDHFQNLSDSSAFLFPCSKSSYKTLTSAAVPAFWNSQLVFLFDAVLAYRECDTRIPRTFPNAITNSKRLNNTQV